MKEIKSIKIKNRTKGQIGETIAEKYLIDKDYYILERNYKTPIGEIDIIAEKDDRIIFVEVKTRATARFGYPREAVTPQKQRTIQLVAMQYLKYKRKNNALMRFDVIEILGDNITHIENAF